MTVNRADVLTDSDNIWPGLPVDCRFRLACVSDVLIWLIGNNESGVNAMTVETMYRLSPRDLRAMYRAGGPIAESVYWIALARGVNL